MFWTVTNLNQPQEEHTNSYRKEHDLGIKLRASNIIKRLLLIFPSAADINIIDLYNNDSMHLSMHHLVYRHLKLF